MEDKKSKNLLKSFQMQCGFFQMKNNYVYFHNIITKNCLAGTLSRYWCHCWRSRWHAHGGQQVHHPPHLPCLLIWSLYELVDSGGVFSSFVLVAREPAAMPDILVAWGPWTDLLLTRLGVSLNSKCHHYVPDSPPPPLPRSGHTRPHRKEVGAAFWLRDPHGDPA